MNDDIEKINDINRRIDFPPKSEGDQSRAAYSHITTNEEDKRIGMAEKIILDLGNQRTDIDAVKLAVQQIAQQVNQITQAMNQIVNSNPNSETPKALNMETITALGELAEKGMQAYKQFKGEPPAAAPLIDQAFINKRMVQSFMDDLDTGTSITNFIKDSLKKKVTKEVINSSLSDMGKDTHAPQ